MLFKIKAPIWKNKSIGLNENKLDENNEIEILYKDRAGERLWPDKYKITKKEALSYSLMVVKGIRLRIVPIMFLEKV